MSKSSKTKAQIESAPKPFASAFRLFAPSINVFQRNILGFILFLLVPLFLSNLGSIATGLRGDTGLLAQFHGIYGVLTIVGLVISVVTAPALIKIQLLGAQGKTISPDEAFSFGLSRLLRFAGLAIVLALVFVISMLLLIIPFFFMLRRYILAPYYLIDQDMGIKEAMRASAADSKKYSSTIWGLIGVEMLLALTSILTFIGIFASIARVAYANAPAVRYEQIKAARKGKQPLAPIEV